MMRLQEARDLSFLMLSFENNDVRKKVSKLERKKPREQSTERRWQDMLENLFYVEKCFLSSNPCGVQEMGAVESVKARF